MTSRWVIQVGLCPMTNIPTGDERGKSHPEDGGRDLERSGRKPRKLATTKCGGARNRRSPPRPEPPGKKRPGQCPDGLAASERREDAFPLRRAARSGLLCSCRRRKHTLPRSGPHGPALRAPRTALSSRVERALPAPGSQALSAAVTLPMVLLPGLPFRFLGTPSCPWPSFPWAQVRNASAPPGGSARIPRPPSTDTAGTWGLGGTFRTSPASLRLFAGVLKGGFVT